MAVAAEEKYAPKSKEDGKKQVARFKKELEKLSKAVWKTQCGTSDYSSSVEYV